MGEQAIRERIAGSSAWEVQKQLGRGQYGTAYLVEWTGKTGKAPRAAGARNAEATSFTLGDRAVAKVVGLEALPEKEHTLAFQEVELMRKLRHAHIVSLLDHFITQAGSELCIVMDFCDSGDLRGEVRRRAGAKPPDHIPEETVMLWFVQLTLGLNYIHQNHILHRDLKSSNVFLNATTNGPISHDVKIGDFGIARVLEGTVDVAATVVGTPYYMSPEVCKSEPYGYKSDIWALGCVLYEMCMLKHAFESQSLLGLVYKIVSESYDPIPKQYSPDLQKLLERILNKSHFQRPTGRDLITDPYVKSFVPESEKETAGCRTGREAQASTHWTSREKISLQGGGKRHFSPPNIRGMARLSEPTPQAPAVQPFIQGPSLPEPPARRKWTSGDPMPDETQLHPQVLVRRICLALGRVRQNWLQVFASFDKQGNGQLTPDEFDHALTSMALGLSESEIRQVRAHLQGGDSCVTVDRFGAALHEVPQHMLQFEEWGQNAFADLARQANKRNGSNMILVPGAHVRAQGLQRGAGLKLNGCEGVVDSFDPSACRWVVKFNSNGDLKSLREENLLVLQPGDAPGLTRLPSGASGNAPDTAALYRQLCEGSETTAAEERFLSVVQRLLPHLTEAERRRLFWLVPKTREGRVDVPSFLAQLVATTANEEQPLSARGPPCSIGHGGAPLQVPPSPAGSTASNTSPRQQQQKQLKRPQQRPQQQQLTPSPRQERKGGAGVASLRSPAPPGFIPSPRLPPDLKQTPSASSTARPAAAPASKEQVRAEIVLLRLAQRLHGAYSSVPGPGVDVLRLFAAPDCDDMLQLEELLDAASVMPLGISRAEAQSVFVHVQAKTGFSPRDTLSFASLASATEAASAAGAPMDVASLEHVDIGRVTAAMQRIGSAGAGRASHQEFRLALMQAEPYLTPGQLEWLALLTDKDGEGRLIPRSLAARLSTGAVPTRGITPRGAAHQVLVPPRPLGSSNGPVAKNTPRSMVAALTLARLRDRLQTAGSKLTLESVLSLFDLDGRSQMNRTKLADLLGHLRLGISAAEADELVSSVAGAGNGGHVPLASLYNVVSREEEACVQETRDMARQRLVGQGDALAEKFVDSAEGGEWLPEDDFCRCFTMALDPPPDADVDEQFVLLAEKNVAGDIWWRSFARLYADWQDPDWDDGASGRSDSFEGTMGGTVVSTHGGSEAVGTPKPSSRSGTITTSPEKDDDEESDLSHSGQTRCNCSIS